MSQGNFVKLYLNLLCIYKFLFCPAKYYLQDLKYKNMVCTLKDDFSPEKSAFLG